MRVFVFCIHRWIEFDAFGDVMQPTNKSTTAMSNSSSMSRPTNAGQGDKSTGQDQKILSTDLDMSLASLANNLDINYKNNNFQ